MTHEWAVALVIALMAVGTYLTRAGGYWLMRFVRVTPRVERLLRVLAGSVFVAIVTGQAVKGDAAACVAIVVSITVMALTRSAVAAMVVGVGVAALVRLLART
jgi:uncharacterized membrane protein